MTPVFSQGPSPTRLNFLRSLLLTFYEPELLYPPAPIGLGNVDVAFGVDGQGVTMREITELMAGTAEGGEDLSAVEGVNLLVAAVHHVLALSLDVPTVLETFRI